MREGERGGERRERKKEERERKEGREREEEGDMIDKQKYPSKYCFTIVIFLWCVRSSPKESRLVNNFPGNKNVSTRLYL